MATLELTSNSFDDILNKGGLLLIDAWAAWCGPCLRFSPIYERVAAKHPDILFGKINTEEEPELASRFGIRAIPTLMIFRDGVLLFSEAGLMPEAGLEQLIRQARAVDMGEVLEKIKQSKGERAQSVSR
jgi:thioredoxin 1